jgi:pilus assembly protein Flp/PilA
VDRHPNSEDFAAIRPIRGDRQFARIFSVDPAADRRTQTLGDLMYDLVNYVRIRLTAMARTERGASAVEYGLLVALIAIAIIAGATLLGGKLDAMFSRTSSSLG